MTNAKRIPYLILALLVAMAFGPADLGAQEQDFELAYYQLHLRPNLSDESIEARAELDLICRRPTTSFSLILQAQLEINSCELDGQPVAFARSGKIVRLTLPYSLSENSRHSLVLTYYGQPLQSDNPPWQSGYHFSLDHQDRSWLTVCGGNGEGAEWLPHFSGVRADSLLVAVVTPERLAAVSNGQLVSAETDEDEHEITHQFKHRYPILPNELSWGLGRYERMDTTFRQIDGREYPLQYFVLDYHSARARQHFQQTNKAFAAWEHYLGPPSFPGQGITLMEVPFVSFTRPGLIAYGNRFMRGAYGGFIPRSMHWDHALVRHTARMYVIDRFPMVNQDDRWLPEGLTTYLESLYVEFHFGQAAAMEYLERYRPYLRDRQPLVDALASDLDLNDAEFQAKGAFFLHTLRTTLQDDGLWFYLLRNFFVNPPPAKDQTMAFQRHLEAGSGLDLAPLFRHFMQERSLPVIEIRQETSATDGQQYWYRLRPGQAQLPLTVSLSLSDRIIQVSPLVAEWQALPETPGLTIDQIKLSSGAAAVRLVKVRVP